jgi:hypothetical protein
VPPISPLFAAYLNNSFAFYRLENLHSSYRLRKISRGSNKILPHIDYTHPMFLCITCFFSSIYFGIKCFQLNTFSRKTTDFLVVSCHPKNVFPITFSVGGLGSGKGWCRRERGWCLGCAMVLVFAGRGISIGELRTKNLLHFKKM